MSQTNKKFRPGSGTIDKGREYEEKVTAFLLLKACQDTDNFWIASNMDGMAPLDDVIICTKKLGKNVAYFCQIKHSQKDKILPGKQLDDAQTPLSMHVYYNKFKNIKVQINNVIPNYCQPVDIFKIVIFTNRRICKRDNMFKPEFDHIFNTNNGEVYGLNSATFSNINPDFEKFLKSVNVYSNQGHAANIEENIQICMKDILKISVQIREDSLTNYMKYIQNWMQITQEKIGLDYNLVKKLLEFSFLLSQAYEIDISQNINNNKTQNKQKNINNNIPGYYLWEDIENKSLFINESYLSFITDMISNKLHHFNMEQAASDIGDILFQNYDYQKLTIKQKYILSCFLGLSPFILDQSLNLPQLQFIKHVPTGNIDGPNNLDQISHKTFLQLLDDRVTLSCGRKIVLKNTLKEKNILMKLTISDALSLVNRVDNSNKIGNGILFERNLKKIYLKIEALRISNDCNDLFVLNIRKLNKENVIEMLGINEEDTCNENNYEDKFKYVFVKEENEFKTKILSRNVHFVKINQNIPISLEWIGTHGNVDNIKQFREGTVISKKVGNNSLMHLKAIHNYFQQSFIIISGVPGIGKSTAMKQIALSAPVDMLVLEVKLQEEEKYFKTLQKNSNAIDSITYLEHFYKSKTLFLRELFKLKLKNKEVLILFDGFDEIAPSFTGIVSKIITRIREDGFKIVLTTRTILQKDIEEIFSTFAISLCAFTREEQENYLEKYFVLNNKGGVSNQNIKTILDQINSENTSEFCSIPLHVNLVADTLLEDFNMVINGKINLLNIYEQFTNKKIDIYEDKIKNTNTPKGSIKNYHKYFAIQTLFSRTKQYELVRRDISSTLLTCITMLKDGEEKVGFLISDVDQIFVHKTIAEYFAGKWLAEIITNENNNKLLENEKKFGLEILKSEIFNKQFDTLRLFFNLVINKNCKLHEAIILKKFNYAHKMIKNNTKEVYNLNKYKQTLLHTLISSCNIDEKSYSLNKELIQILNLLFINYTDILQSEDSCKNSPRDYAKNRVSNSSLKINLIEILIEAEESKYFVSCNEPFNVIEFLVAAFNQGINILHVLKAEPIDFESLASLVKREHFSAVRDLLKTPEGLNAVDGNNNNLLHWAIENNNIKLLSTLLSQQKDFLNLFSARNNNNDTPILIAMQFGNFKIIKTLINKLPRLTVKDQDVAIIYAVIGGVAEVIDYLFKRDLVRTNYMYKNLLPIYIAYKQGNNNALEYLKKYIKPEYKVTALHYASTYKNQFIIESVTKLLKTSVPISPNINISTEYLEWLEQTTDVNAQDNSSQTPLIYAVKNDNMNVFDYLISIGADLFYSDKNGFTCLHHAAQSGSLQALKKLCLKMDDINLGTISGLTPLHLSVKNKNLEAVRILIENGANLNSIDKLGRTCLHYAIENEDENIVNLLLNNNADVYVEDSEGITCLEMAVRIYNAPIIRLIIEYNPDLNYEVPGLYEAACRGYVGVGNFIQAFHKHRECCEVFEITPDLLSQLFGFRRTIQK